MNYREYTEGFEHGVDVISDIITPALARGEPAFFCHDRRVPRSAAYFKGFEAALESAGYVVRTGKVREGKIILND